jgi:hypothetical protein
MPEIEPEAPTRYQFSLRKLLLGFLLLNAFLLGAYLVPEENPVCGPLSLVKFWPAHRGLGIVLTCAFTALLFSPFARFSKGTVIASVIGAILWLASYYVIEEASLGV